MLSGNQVLQYVRLITSRASLLVDADGSPRVPDKFSASLLLSLSFDIYNSSETRMNYYKRYPIENGQ